MGQEFEDRRVLLVEDDALTLTLLESVIRTFGFHTYSAASATEAKVALTSFDPDLAILDIDLGPGPTGLDFAKMMSKTHPHVAVLFLSRLPYEDAAGTMDSTLLGNIGYLNLGIPKNFAADKIGDILNCNFHRLSFEFF